MSPCLYPHRKLSLNCVSVPITLRQPYRPDYVVSVITDGADPTQTVSPSWVEEVCVSEQVSWASRERQPEIEMGCKSRRTDIHAGMSGRKLQMKGAGGRCRARTVRAEMKNEFVP